MVKLVNWLINEESGQGMVEYGLIILLVALIVIGTSVLNMYIKTGEAIKGNIL